MLILFQSFKLELQILTMNERTFSWHLPEDAVEKLVSLDKKDRREFFSNLPIDNVPIGSLIDFSSISVDNK